MLYDEFLGVETKDRDKLLPIAKIGSEPVKRGTADTIMTQFIKKNIMIDCVEGFLEVDEYSTGKVALV